MLNAPFLFIFLFWSFSFPSYIHLTCKVQRKQKNNCNSSFPKAYNSKWSRSQCSLWKLTKSQFCTCKDGFMHMNHSCIHEKYWSIGMCSSERCRKGKRLAPKTQTRSLNTKSFGDYLEKVLIKMIPWTSHSQCDSVNTFCYCGPKVHMMD